MLCNKLNINNNYYPFGMLMPGRQSASESYRYGFQGQERDDEIKGNGNSLNYKYRMHDPRLGRFFAIDPLVAKYPYNSPYAFSENRVIDKIELEGLETTDTGKNYNPEDGSVATDNTKVTIYDPALKNDAPPPPYSPPEQAVITNTPTTKMHQAQWDMANYVVPLEASRNVLQHFLNGKELTAQDYIDLATTLPVFKLGKFVKLSNLSKAENFVYKAVAKQGDNLINNTSKAILKNGFYEVNGFKFSEYYYKKLWSTGRGAPSLIAKGVLEGGMKTAVPDKVKEGFFKYVYGGWEMVYNPTTKEIWHLQPAKIKK